ncbi:beta-1,3-galactosyl-O-glycosyl-glycoprotein beta-1,6-N-acetylglucosaminyltransferase-like [Gadus morhua]|uniref:Beta-1,3-galactosyl-O-glycosyl-glycoprotein beta-1,6-N-acetylglucosaminyltransferase-like n=1 Tax=Gadus morhua TaxID=8049 RepID=A0A8C4ZLJ5_GADMO|nr:beta-1,3-galactosyl-O-glycosyl-glycoprotein beta-1,6-N-acetylglucosaminyltransferase-like [Gadus morhua]
MGFGMTRLIKVNSRKLLRVIIRVALVIAFWRVFFIKKPDKWLKKPDKEQLEASSASWEGKGGLNCTAVVLGDPDSQKTAQWLAQNRDYRRKVKLTDEYYIKATHDCRDFRLTRGYATLAFHEEMDFPLAYSIVAHHKVENFERLLRAIYAPQNVYCVHVDTKANTTVAAAIANIASCFPNVFMVSQPVKVVYASWMRVQADLNCMSDLLHVSTEWKYFINLCGQDFPMKTNLEMVRDLKALEGENSIQFKPISKNQTWRVETTWAPVNGHIQSTGKARGPAPLDLSVLKGSAYIVACRGYINSVLTDSRIHELMEWCKDTYSPDEILWATTQQMPGVPGSISATSHVYQADSIARLVLWTGRSKCHGHFVREVCVFNVADLPWILSHHHLFANKFDVESDSVAVYCLEEYLREKRLAEIESDGK